MELSIREMLNKEELRFFVKKSNLRGFIGLLSQWLPIVLATALMVWQPNVGTVVVALVVFASKQLGLFACMHDSGHYSLFKTRWLNNFFGRWFCGNLIFEDAEKYRKVHHQHHTKTGIKPSKDKDDGDPDYLLMRVFPVSKKKMRQMIIEDLTFQTGIKHFKRKFMMAVGILEYEYAGRNIKIDRSQLSPWQKIKIAIRGIYGYAISNAIVFALFTIFASPWFYLIWLGAYLTLFMLLLRIRSITEHGSIKPTSNNLLNTRTTSAPRWERFFLGPLNVNFHLEHHLLMAVPYYKLEKLHKLLMARGFLKNSHIAQSYRESLAIGTLGKS